MHSRMFGGSLDSEGLIKCVYLNDRLYQARPRLVGINFDETVFYRFTVGVNKFSGSCVSIYDPFSRVCVPNKAKKKMNIKVFSLC